MSLRVNKAFQEYRDPQVPKVLRVYKVSLA
jgi:hypothetical protein